MDYKDIFNYWTNSDVFDTTTKDELIGLKDNEKEILDRFHKDLEFGTAGLRGKLGAGTNRMNKYIVARATQALADVIISKGVDSMNRGIAIAHDNRLFSKEFAKISAIVLSENNIKAYLFSSLRPTPELSFAVRHLNAIGGINITASHNPKEYNGYKVYWEEGAQILEDIAGDIQTRIQSMKYSDIKGLHKKLDSTNHLIKIIDSEIDDIYLQKVMDLSINKNVSKDINIVFTPLNGAGGVPVPHVLAGCGYNNVFLVDEQLKPDPNFTTVKNPNPENIKAFSYAIDLGNKVDADILLATDPDCDRVGVMIKTTDGSYHSLNGNQLGSLLIDYILTQRKNNNTLPNDGVIIKSMVTGNLGKSIADKYNIKTVETLTGFKYIGRKIEEFSTKNTHTFVFGYEESMGYLYGDFVRDKDAVVASLLTCEMAAYHKENGRTLLDALDQIYAEHGYYTEEQTSIVLEGVEGANRIKNMIEVYTKDYIKEFEFDNGKITTFIDYSASKINNLLDGTSSDTNLPKTKALKFVLEDNSWFAIRPSGTEPKIKIYVATIGHDNTESIDKLNTIKNTVVKRLTSAK